MDRYRQKFITSWITFQQIGSNGLISFGTAINPFGASLFPSNVPETHFGYILAPFWADADLRLDGEIYYELHTSGDNSISDQLLNQVNGFISRELGVLFEGNWMMVATWDEVHPWPHGSDPVEATEDPYLQEVSVVQCAVCPTVFQLDSLQGRCSSV